MIKSIASLALMTLISAPAFASEWNIDVSHSEVGFKVRHMMVSNTSGQFKTFKGTISSKDKKNFLEGLKIAVDIDPASIDTQDKKRDDHLRAPDFFDVKKFPKMTFKSTKVTEVKGDGAKIAGLLTMHGVTQPVILKVEGFDTEIKGPYGMTRRGGTATTTINRKDFGLTWNAALESGGVAVGEKIKITLEIELVKNQPKKK